jgi:hypothetical protein
MWVLVIIVIVVGLAIAAYMALRLAPMQILGVYDRALWNRRDRVDSRYELPVYAQGDLATKWPGWDGWYVLMVPREPEAPVTAIRVSIMTGLYGLEGIDHYAELRGLSAFEAVEYLVMVQTDTTSGLFRRYLPKQTDLAIRRDQLLVVVKDWGEIGGQWPHYRIQMNAPEADMALSLTYTGKHLIWWADFPHLFTYFAAFGDLQGTVTLNGRDYTVTGLGSFEHGFARKPCNYDALLRPLRALQKLCRVTLMHYHYNLLIGVDDFHGGMMLAQGVGIDFRNLGGIYLPDGHFVRLTKIEIEYVELEELDQQAPSPAISLPKQWIVRASAESGSFEYTATRQSPPALIATHMMYGDFQFIGRYRAPGTADVVVSGRGYGEFVRM